MANILTTTKKVMLYDCSVDDWNNGSRCPVWLFEKQKRTVRDLAWWRQENKRYNLARLRGDNELKENTVAAIDNVDIT